MKRSLLSNMMFAAGAIGLAAAVALGACSTQQSQQFAANATADAQAIGTVDTALVKLNATVIGNQVQLAQALAATYCPIVNAAVNLGAAIKADTAVAKNVQKFLTKAGPTGALASDVCTAAGYTASTPASAAPAAAVTPATTG
jgi:hypothetical protein